MFTRNDRRMDHSVVVAVTRCLSKDGSKRVLGSRSRGLELFKGFDSLFNVGFGIAEVLVGKNAVSLLVQDVGDTSWEQSKAGLWYTKVGTDLVTLIGQNGEGKSHFGSKGLLGFDALSGDSNDIGSVGLADLIDAVVEGAGLDGASRTGIGGGEINNKRLLDGGTGDGLAILVDKGKVWGGLADSKVESRRRSSSRLGHKGVGRSHEAGSGDNGRNELHGGIRCKLYFCCIKIMIEVVGWPILDSRSIKGPQSMV